MSSHSYRTTTVEYYEYLMPDTHESMFWPFNAAGNYLVVPEDNNRHSELIYNMVLYYQRPTIFEYRQQNEPQCHQPLPNSEDDQNQADDIEEEFDQQTENVEPSPSKPKGKQKNVYQAEQGYLVEEPTSESSEEDQESPS
ncbi:hypothetical protein ACLKA7_009158 [Drosophila subpalustris]